MNKKGPQSTKDCEPNIHEQKNLDTTVIAIIADDGSIVYSFVLGCLSDHVHRIYVIAKK